MGDPVEQLFAATPQEFVAARDALARQLRRDGDRAGADRVKALRRPPPSVWALNALARERPDEVAELLAAGADLPAAQQALLDGDPPRFRAALARHRELVAALARTGAELVAGRGVSATDQRQEVALDLQAASTTPEAIEPFRQGRLERRPGELGEPVTGLRDRADDGPDREPPEPADTERAETERAAAERAAAERRRAAAQRVAEARNELDEAQAALEPLRRDVAEAEAELAAARRRLDSAALEASAAARRLAEVEAAARSDDPA